MFTRLIWLSKPESDYRKECIDGIIRYYNKEISYNHIDFTKETEALMYHRCVTLTDKDDVSNIIKSIEGKCKA